jgi:hypothetical protein
MSIYFRQSSDYFGKLFLCQDAEMYFILHGLAFGTWVIGCAPQTLNEDRIAHIISQYCYYIHNSPWYVYLALKRIQFDNNISRLNIVRNTRPKPGPYKHFNLREGQKLEYWTSFFLRHAPLRIDQYLDIQCIMGLNSSFSTAASQNDFQERSHYHAITPTSNLYQYLLKVHHCLPSRYLFTSAQSD